MVLKVSDRYGLKKGKVYDALYIESELVNFDLLSVIDDFGEEYGYPREWFEIIDGNLEE